MPLPSNAQERIAFLRFVANNNAAALEYLQIICAMVYFADDAVDEPLDAAGRQELVAKLLWAAVVDLPRCRFHQLYAVQLAPLLSEVIVSWQKSDEWRKSGDATRETYGFVRRENIDGLAVAVAAIVGGREHALAVTEAIMDVCHATGETVQDWVSE